MLLFMEKLYDMHCHVGFAPAPATVAAEGAQAGIGALSCTVEPTEYEQLRAALADAPNVAVALGAHPWWIADVGETELARFCELARTTRFIGEIGLDFAGPRDTEESRALQTSAFACILATCNESAAPLAPTNPEGATATSGQNRTCIATTSPEANPPSEGTLTRSATDTAPKLISIHAINAAAAALDALEQASTAEVWRAELNNALSGIAQLKGIDRAELAEHIASTSRELLIR